jgi:nucleotide-binding universal stress UspA family protein
MKALVAVDGSEAALDAVRHALHLWREGLKVRLVLATVQAPTYLYEMVLPPDSDVLEKVSGAVGGRALKGAEALCTDAGMPFEREIGSGEPAPTLIEIAERYDCEAIVLEARGLGALSGALLGSVSQSVLHTSKIPVTVVRRAEE